MKKLPHIFLALITCSTAFGQKGKLLPDSVEIIYLLNKMQDPDVVAGVFLVPDNTTPLSKLKSGNYPEQDDNFLNVFIEHNLMKLYPVDVFKNQTDNVCIIQLPLPNGEHDKLMSFLPYPGTKWFVLMQKNIRKGEARGWLKKVKNHEKVSFLNDETAFSVANERMCNFATSWNKKFPKPDNIQLMGNSEVSDLKSVYAFVNSGLGKLTDEEFTAKLEKFKTDVKTPLGKMCCRFIKRK